MMVGTSATHAQVVFEWVSILGAVIALAPYSIAGLVAGLWLAPRIGGSRIIWSILLFVPLLNLFAGLFFMILVAGRIAERLNEILRMVRWRWDEAHEAHAE